jgi:glycosyltransferase involved in cell wall biosynthesis
MAQTKVLYVLHNHPSVRPGGAEAYALELYEAMRSSDDFDPVLVARIGPNPAASKPTFHPGAPFSTAEGGDSSQYYVFTDEKGYDFFYGTHADKSLYTTHFANFLEAHKPDVVHFQHTLFLGYDLLSLTRKVLPHAPIVYTLHEYLPICNREGQLLRTFGNELCPGPTPRRCNECFPEWPEQYFFLRDRFVKAQFEQVDLFLAPSRFLLERYVEWGIPREKIRFEDYGRRPEPRLPETDRDQRTRLGFFGQINRYKGLDVLLRALPLLRERLPVHLWIHGANLELQDPDVRELYKQLFEATSGMVTFSGAYDHATLPRLMANVDWVIVPSRWWENSPLVIQEAFMHGRPVICSNIGGMAEKVTDGVNGLHFEVGNVGGLSSAIYKGITTPGLWEELQAGIPEVFGMDEHISNLSEIYRDLSVARSSELAEASSTG